MLEIKIERNDEELAYKHRDLENSLRIQWSIDLQVELESWGKPFVREIKLDPVYLIEL